MNNHFRILTIKTLFKPINLLSMAMLLNACGNEETTEQTTNPTPEDPKPPIQNIAPTANAGTDKTIVEQTQVTLNGSNSRDTDGTISHYSWQQTQGSAISLSDTASSTPTFTAPDIQTDETLTFELTVTDNDNATHSDSVSILVTANLAPNENIAPTANAGGDQTISEYTHVTLNGSNSQDSDGEITSYQWQQTQGTSVSLNTSDQAIASFSFSELISDEALTFELTVSDDSGDTHTDEVTVHIQFFKAKLNDTGLTIGANYPNGNNASCIGESVSQQDCAQGNDATNNSDSDGHSGFSYTKLNASGDTLPANATSWSCVKDNVTGLIWEVKTTDGGLHDNNIDYRWGGIGAEPFGSEFYDDWNVLLNGSNDQALCGFSDWRVPHINELEGLVSFDRTNPAIDIDYFPNTLSLGYLSINAAANDDTVAWYVHFNGGWTHSNALRNNSDPDRLKYVRLVRGPLVF